MKTSNDLTAYIDGFKDDIAGNNILLVPFVRNGLVGCVTGLCTFPHFIFSYFYLYTEGLLGSIVNVARDGIQFVA